MKLSKKLFAMLLAFSLVLSVFAVVSPVVFAQSTQLVINEVCSGNKGANGNVTSATNSDGSYCDWVEIYNNSATELDLSGWGLSDGKSNFYKFVFPDNTKIKAHSFLLVYCSKAFVGEDTDLCAAFGISSDGEKIYLTSKDGAEQDVVEVPALSADTTYGRYPDGGDSFKTLAPTPYKSNAESSEVSVSEPVFSLESGMYKTSVSLTITTADQNVTIYYTTDGSDPATSDTKIKYTGAISVKDRAGAANVLAAVDPDYICMSYGGDKPTDSEVDKATVIRAVCVNNAGVCSKTVTKSYFVGSKVCSYGNIPILSVTTDFDNLFDYNTGIFCNGKVWEDFQKENPGVNEPWLAQTNATQRGREWERNCHIDLIEPDGTVSLSDDCGMRTQGGSSRNTLQKSLRFYARKEYGNSYFEAPLFSDAIDEKGNVIDKYKTFMVRNGGNDSTYLKFTDSYIQNLVADRDMETQQGRGTLVFLDGEYWGFYVMQEDYTEDYFEQKYGVDSKEVAMLKVGEVEIGEPEDAQSFYDMYKYITSAKVTDERYAEICKMMDVESFADYMSTELFICNADWPNNNWAAWHTKTVTDNAMGDGKWRFILYDTEYSTNQYDAAKTRYTYDTYDLAFKDNLGSSPITSMLWSLKQNAQFKEMFIKRTLDMANVNFDSTASVQKFNTTYSKYSTHIYQTKTRFHNMSSSNITNRRNQIRSFFTNRSRKVFEFLKSAALLKCDDALFTLSSNISEGGIARMNSADVDFAKYADNQLSCTYYSIYDTTLAATAKSGYVFKKWTGAVNSYNSEITLNSNNYADVQVQFVAEGEFKYGDSTDDGLVTTADVLRLRKHLANNSIEMFTAAADCNADGIVNTKDVLLLRKFLAGMKVTLGKQ